MSINTHFHILEKVKKFPGELTFFISREIEKNKSVIKGSIVEDDVILINFKGHNFETFFVTTDYNKSYFKLKFPDNSLYSGFKYERGDSNKVACIIALLLKIHLEDGVIISSDGLLDYVEEDWEYACDYINKNYGVSVSLREGNPYPTFIIDGKNIYNKYDEDQSIFNSMFTVVKYD